MAQPLTIVGQGIAGTCLAWQLWRRGVDFRIIDTGRGGSSRVAAGLVNPVTGKGWNASWRIDEFLPEAIGFYAWLAETLGQEFWDPRPVVRLIDGEREEAKARAKWKQPQIAPWVAGEVAPPNGWRAAIELKGGGRVDLPALLEASRRFFLKHGLLETARHEIFGAELSMAPVVWCEGAAGMLQGRLSGISHRCAKGEILTIECVQWNESRVLVGGGGWLVPLGGRQYKVGATYEWDDLDEMPTEAGRAKVEAIAARLVQGPFRVIAHEAGVRPILRCSQPVIGALVPSIGTMAKEYVFTGLGSKGALYAPGVSARLAAYILEGKEIEADLDVRQLLRMETIELTEGERPTQRAHREVERVVQAGDITIDATAGNGHDTVFLAKLVGELGKVHAYDVQEAAIASTRARCVAQGVEERVLLHHESHVALWNHCEAETVAAVMFNLGYLPGADHEVITTSEETLQALQAAGMAIKGGGCLCVVCYPGHAGGDEEAALVEEWMNGLCLQGWDVAKYARSGTLRPAPFLILGKKPHRH